MTRPMTTTEAAEALGVTRRRVQALAKAGRLRGGLVGRDYLIDPRSVAEFQRLPAGRPPKKKPKKIQKSPLYSVRHGV